MFSQENTGGIFSFSCYFGDPWESYAVVFFIIERPQDQNMNTSTLMTSQMEHNPYEKHFYDLKQSMSIEHGLFEWNSLYPALSSPMAVA